MGSISCFELLNLKNCANILEVGCGPAYTLDYALQFKGKETVYYATDFSKGMLNMAKKNLDKLLPDNQHKNVVNFD